VPAPGIAAAKTSNSMQPAPSAMKAEANNVKAQNDLVRYKQLVDKQEISQQQYDQAERCRQGPAAASVVAGAPPWPTRPSRRSLKLRENWRRRKPTGATPRLHRDKMQVSRAKAASAEAQVLQKKAALDQATTESAIRPKLPAPVGRHRQRPATGRSRPETWLPVRN